MTTGTKWLAPALALAATVTMAAEATDPTARAWQEHMDSMAANVGRLGDMAGGKAPFDAAVATTAREHLVALSAGILAKFETRAADPASKALPAIWDNFADFSAKAGALNAAVTALDVATLDGVRAGMRDVGGACAACHQTYRAR